MVGVEEFPGEIAGASLKRWSAMIKHGDAPRAFPGEIAGASLKPPPASRAVYRATVSSPAKSPGPH